MFRRSTPDRAKAGVSDLVWDRLRQEAQLAVEAEPQFATLLHAALLEFGSFEEALVHRVVRRIQHDDLPAEVPRHAFADALADDVSIGLAIRADLQAVLERDPAATRLLEPFLYFKGFHAIQIHRLAHWLWQRGRRNLALYLQCRSSESLQVDIHPAARLGRGLFFDHATGIVIGETAVVGDDVSILQGVTLGGTGLQTGARHPRIGRGVLIGAGAKVLGGIDVGPGARIGAGSMVLQPVPAHVTAAGNPARIIGIAGSAEPGRTMDQLFDHKA